MHRPFPGRLADERGATAAEYAIVAALIGAVVIGVVTAIGLSVIGLFERVTGF